MSLEKRGVAVGLLIALSSCAAVLLIALSSCAYVFLWPPTTIFLSAEPLQRRLFGFYNAFVLDSEGVALIRQHVRDVANHYRCNPD